jgi:hypothetical protein
MALISPYVFEGLATDDQLRLIREMVDLVLFMTFDGDFLAHGILHPATHLHNLITDFIYHVREIIDLGGENPISACSAHDVQELEREWENWQSFRIGSTSQWEHFHQFTKSAINLCVRVNLSLNLR